MLHPTSNEIYRFGTYEVDLASGELRKSGIKLRLPDQAFRVLVSLLERPSEVVTREDLRAKLWPNGTFVDFDHGLNTVINKLREALSDTAANPRFIETLARRGYRFIAPVEFVAGAHAEEVTVEPAPLPDALKPLVRAVPQAPAVSLLTASLLTTADEVPAANRGRVRLLFLLLQVMYLIFYITALARLGRIQDLLEQFAYSRWIIAVLIISASIGIPVRLYLISATAFDLPGLTAKFSRLFIAVLLLDCSWAIAPFLLTPQIGVGLALAATAALIYSPFAQRALLLIADRTNTVPSRS
ncbi:MAG: winged helix-turn-helix domain-containing protein [Terriglobales bacterium]